MLFFQTATIKEIKYFGNPSTPNDAFFQMVDIKKHDPYELRKAKQLQQRFIRSGYYDKVTLLSIPKKNDYNLNYYFIEKDNFEFFNYGLFLDASQNPGLMLSYSWDFIKKTGIRFKSRLLYSKNLEDYRMSFYDDYAGYNIFYDFSFGFMESNYLFQDAIYSSDLSFEKRYMSTVIGYSISNRQKISIDLNRYAIKTNKSILNNGLKEDFYFRTALSYEYENLDWYVFPKDGYHVKMELSQNSSDNDFDFSEYRIQAKAYVDFFDDISLKTGYYNYWTQSHFPNILNDHFEENSNIFSFQDRYIGSKNHSYLFNELLLNTGIEYDPNLENDLMWQLGIESVTLLNSNSSNQINQVFGLNFRWVLNRTLYKISISVNNNKAFNLNLYVKS